MLLLQPQFNPISSWVDFFEKVFIYVKERLFLKWYKGRKRFFPLHSIWSERVSKLKVCPSSVSSTNPSAQNSKLENNALDNTSLLLMCRRYNLLFYSQFSCAIARFLFSNISVFFSSCIFNVLFELWRWFERFVHVNWLNKI